MYNVSTVLLMNKLSANYNWPKKRLSNYMDIADNENLIILCVSKGTSLRKHIKKAASFLSCYCWGDDLTAIQFSTPTKHLNKNSSTFIFFMYQELSVYIKNGKAKIWHICNQKLSLIEWQESVNEYTTVGHYKIHLTQILVSMSVPVQHGSSALLKKKLA